MDSELDEFLRFAAGQIHETDDITTIEPGLKDSSLNYAGYQAFQKQAIRWAQRMSEKFLLLESPLDDGTQARSNHFLQLSKEYYKQGVELRDAFYMRHGRRHAPAFNVYKPSIPSIGPRR